MKFYRRYRRQRKEIICMLLATFIITACLMWRYSTSASVQPMLFSQDQVVELEKLKDNSPKLKSTDKNIQFRSSFDFFLPETNEVGKKGSQNLPDKFLKNTEEKRNKFEFRIQPVRIVGKNGLMAIRKFQGNTWSGIFLKGAIVFMVRSSSGHDLRRKFLRSTWVSVRDIDGWKLEVVFVIGIPSNIEEQMRLQTESSKFGDILQYNGSDDNSSETLKVLAGLQWASDILPGDVYYASSTDDCLINIAAVRDHIAEQVLPAGAQNQKYYRVASDWSSVTSSQPQTVYCFEKYSESDLTERQLNLTRSVDRMTYEPVEWPPHCTEGLYVIPVSLASELHELSRVTDLSLPHYLHDVFVTGILRRKVKYGDENISEATTTDKQPLLRLEMLPRSSRDKLDSYGIEAEKRLWSVWSYWYKKIRFRYHIISSTRNS